MENIIEDRCYLHYLNLLPELGPTRLWGLYRYFGSYKTAVNSSYSELITAGFTHKIAGAIRKHCSEQDLQSKINQEAEQLSQLGITIIDFRDNSFPPLLKELAVPPALLYCRGNINQLQEKICLAIVGSRKPTSYGLTVTENLVADLVSSGIVVVSGLAFGIDIAVHQAVLKNKGTTIAVLPGGVDNYSIYPPSHLSFAKQIMQTGCVVSECPPQSPTMPYTFLARNRIIAGLCKGVVVVECTERSGALMTARYANDENRNVYAVPGSIFNPQNFGPNKLLKQGAMPIASSADILKDLNLISTTVSKKLQNLTVEEKLVLQYINTVPTSVDNIIKEISSKRKIIRHEVIGILSTLELKGFIALTGPEQYSLIG